MFDFKRHEGTYSLGEEVYTDVMCWLAPSSVLFHVLMKSRKYPKGSFTIEDFDKSIAYLHNEAHRMIGVVYTREELIEYLEEFSFKYPALSINGNGKCTFDYEEFFKEIPYGFWKKWSPIFENEEEYRTMYLAYCCEVNPMQMDTDLLMAFYFGFLLKDN